MHVWNLKHFECWCVEKMTINLIHCFNVIIVLFLSLHTCQRNKIVNNYPTEREKSVKCFCNIYAVTRIIWNALKVCYFLLHRTTKNPCGSKTWSCRKYGMGGYNFVGIVVEKNVGIARYVLEPWREQNHQILKSKKLQ